MTGKEIITKLKNFGNLEVDVPAAVGWIDSAQKDIALEYPLLVKSTLASVTTETIISVASGLLDVISVTCSDGDYPLTDLIISNTRIMFVNPATNLTIVYTRIYDTYTSQDNELTVHPIFHDSIVLYLIYKYYEASGEGDSEESGLAERSFQKWYDAKIRAVKELNKSINASHDMDPVETVNTLPHSHRRHKEDDFLE